jgi:hypothetical protein
VIASSFATLASDGINVPLLDANEQVSTVQAWSSMFFSFGHNNNNNQQKTHRHVVKRQYSVIANILHQLDVIDARHVHRQVWFWHIIDCLLFVFKRYTHLLLSYWQRWFSGVGGWQRMDTSRPFIVRPIAAFNLFDGRSSECLDVLFFFLMAVFWMLIVVWIRHLTRRQRNAVTCYTNRPQQTLLLLLLY